MRNRFHEPRSDTPSPRRPDDVNANKSLYGNERETPSIRPPNPEISPRRGPAGPHTLRIARDRSRTRAVGKRPGMRMRARTARTRGRPGCGHGQHGRRPGMPTRTARTRSRPGRRNGQHGRRPGIPARTARTRGRPGRRNGQHGRRPGMRARTARTRGRPGCGHGQYGSRRPDTGGDASPADHIKHAVNLGHRNTSAFRHPSPEPNTVGKRLTWDG